MTINPIRPIAILSLLWLILLPCPAWSGITAPITLDINHDDNNPNSVRPEYEGRPNSTNGCSFGSGCLKQAGFVFGTVDGVVNSAHIHTDTVGDIFDPAGNDIGGDDNSIEYHSDSPGIYFRAADGSAFSFDSVRLDARVLGNNPAQNFKGQTAFWEIIGFNDAYTDPFHDLNGNPFNWGTSSIDTNQAPNKHPKQVAYQVVRNGFNGNPRFISDLHAGTLVLNDSFKNVKAVWIHYGNVPFFPDPNVTSLVLWKILADDFKVSAPISNCP